MVKALLYGVVHAHGIDPRGSGLHLKHKPWEANALEQAEFNFIPGINYPLPMCNTEGIPKEHREKIWGMRKTQEAKSENERILKTHTRKGRRNA